jgi:integrase
VKLTKAIEEYLQHRQSAGRLYTNEKGVLRAFSRSLGDVAAADVSSDSVRQFLATLGNTDSYRHHSYYVLRGLYRYLAARGYVDVSPVPTTAPQRPADFQPYIYSQDELRRLLAATDSYYRCKTRAGLYGASFRGLLLLLYGTGMRISEAVSLRLSDVDLHDRLLTVRESKFYKTRLVPIGTQLTRVLRDYVRKQRPACLSVPSAPLFVSSNGSGFARDTAEKSFRRLRTAVGLSRPGPPRCQPRLHDLRHTFAVHRLLAWYKAGEDVQRLLPQLATYLGHRDLVSTQRYLTMTPEVLREAGKRFASYAFGGSHE